MRGFVVKSSSNASNRKEFCGVSIKTPFTLTSLICCFYTLIGIYKMLAWADPIDKKTQKNFRWPGEVFLAVYVMPFFEEDGTGGRV
jgi:hypothetical protein